MKPRKVHFAWATGNSIYHAAFRRRIRKIEDGKDDVQCNSQLTEETQVTIWAPFVTCARCRKLMIQAGITRESRSHHLPEV